MPVMRSGKGLDLQTYLQRQTQDTTAASTPSNLDPQNLDFPFIEEVNETPSESMEEQQQHLGSTSKPTQVIEDIAIAWSTIPAPHSNSAKA